MSDLKLLQRIPIEILKIIACRRLELEIAGVVPCIHQWNYEYLLLFDRGTGYCNPPHFKCTKCKYIKYQVNNSRWQYSWNVPYRHILYNIMNGKYEYGFHCPHDHLMFTMATYTESYILYNQGNRIRMV